MSKDSLAKYYQNKKGSLQKKQAIDIKVFLKKKKDSNNMVVNNTKMHQKMKCKSLLSVGKNIK